MLPCIMSQVWVLFTFELGKTRVKFHLYCVSGPPEVPVAIFGEGDLSTEAETKRQRRPRSASLTHRLRPLAQSASPQLTYRVEMAVDFYWSRLSTMVGIN